MADLRVAPAPSSGVVRARFRRQGRRDTLPELAVRRRLHARGVRYRVDVRPCRETRARGDLVWKGRRLVVFGKDPSAPHRSQARGGPLQRGRRVEPSAGNRRADAVLTGLGWRVLRFWEHEDPEAVVEVICAELARRTRPCPGGGSP
jgi:DNA mismatch endonuclease (patch repair protein)